MNHEFVILIDDELKTYDKYEDIPESFDNLIKFLPSVPSPPHTDAEHDEIESWNGKLQELMKRERK